MPDSSSKIRRKYRILRRSIPHREQLANAGSVARHLINSGLLLRRGVIAAYLPNQADGELDTAPLLAQIWAMGKRLVLPVVAGNGPLMNFFDHQPACRLVANRYGIPEPAPGSAHINGRAIAIMLLPLVAFDNQGFRLGMGAGYYDRYLGRLPRRLRPRLIGIGHEIQRSPQPLAHESWDVPLDDVITERGWQRFR